MCTPLLISRLLYPDLAITIVLHLPLDPMLLREHRRVLRERAVLYFRVCGVWKP
jgi:hypothetical protein